MELFKLLGKIAVDNSDANKALDETSQKGEKTESKLGKAFGAVGKGAVAVGKTVATGLAVGATAFAGLTAKALSAGGELEQNMGGSEAVFKQYAGKMQDTAKKAFSNMGLSTSDFLGTANKMGALFQGAGFSIKESSELSASAMQRAADVASIMGIDTSAAMEAIAGAAKGNFTMMDNLGVAMNDTAIEAYALSKGIDKSTKDMTQQEKIGLAMEMFMEKTAYAAGNYAKENETLAGSLGTAKAALTNFLDGSGSVEDLVSSFGNLANVAIRSLEEILPRLTTGLVDIVNQIMPMLPPLLQKLLPSIINGATSLINGLVSAFPNIISALMGALPALIHGVQTIINALIAALPGIIEAIVSALPTLIPMLINALVSIIVTLCNSFSSIIQPIIDYLPDIIIAIVEALVNNLPALIEGVISLIMGIVEALPTIIESLIDALPTIVEMLVTAILENLPILIKGAIQLVVGIVSSLDKILSSLKKALPNAMKGIWDAVKKVFAKVGEWFGKKFTEAKEKILAAWSNVKEKFASIKDKVTGVFSNIGAWFKNKFNDAKNKVVSAFSNIKEKFTSIKDKITSVFSNIKEKLSKPFENARDAIKGVVDKIKGFFSGLKLKFPNIKLPHFKVSPSGWKIGDLLKGSIPKLDVQWYAEAMNNPMIMTRPTIFGYDASTGQLMGGGEAGSEVVSGTNTLMNMIQAAVSAQNEAVVTVLYAILDAIVNGNTEMIRALLADKTFQVGEREFGRLVRKYA